MRAFLSFAKFNLYLAVLAKRPDGYHEIDTVMQSVDLCDRLEMEPLDEPRLEVTANVADVPSGRGNLVWRALALLQSDCGVRTGMRVAITKRIPARAGLGGGSSNAACALGAANLIWDLKLDEERLMRLGSAIGSDVPFFIRGGTQRCQGRGERVTPVTDLPESTWIIVKPDFDLATAEVYARTTTSLTAASSKASIVLQSLAKRDLSMVVEGSFNDLESAAILIQAGAAEVKTWMEQRGLASPILAGSGSAWVARSPDLKDALRLVNEGRQRGWEIFVVKPTRRGWSEAKTEARLV